MSGIHCRAVSELRQCTRAQPGIKQTSAGNRLKTLELQEEVNQGKRNSGSLGFQGKCHAGKRRFLTALSARFGMTKELGFEGMLLL